MKCLSDMNELPHSDHAETATHEDSLESAASVSRSCLSLSFLPYPIQTFVSVSFHTHHYEKSSSRLNIESIRSHSHVIFGMPDLVCLSHMI